MTDKKKEATPVDEKKVLSRKVQNALIKMDTLARVRVAGLTVDEGNKIKQALSGKLTEVIEHIDFLVASPQGKNKREKTEFVL
ncbi:MAG: hypothetical protein H7831_16225 [Magnetococcus sp. WYHC-3]